MISHAKASTAGSNSGRSASRRPLNRFGVLVLLALMLVVGACLLPGSAGATETRPQLEAFGSDGTSSTTFESPGPLAFDQGNKHLYVLAQGAGKVYGFDASTPATYTPLGGNFPLAVSGASELADLAADSTSHDLYYASLETGSLLGFDSSGTALGGNFPLEGFSFLCGAAVDPSGNIWIGEVGAGAVQEYDSSGNLIESIDVSGEGGSPCHVALDSDANLYVSEYEGAVWRYSAASGYSDASEVDPALGSPVSTIAVDRSSDDLYVAHSNHVSVFDSSGAVLYEFGNGVSGAQYTGIAIDQASDQVYVSDAGNGVVQVFSPAVPLPDVVTEDAGGITTTLATLHGTVNPNGEQLTDCHFEYGTNNSYGESAPCVPAAASIPPDFSGHAVKADVSGLTPGTTYHFRLVAGTAEGTANGPDRTLTTAIGPPVVSAQSVETVSFSDATLSAQINPEGARTTYHVEYGPTASYGQSTPESAPIGSGADNTDHTVSVHIEGLDPGTAYHFRFVAASPAGSTAGADTSFATYPTPPSFGPCPNDGFRTSLGAHLPDCRAYEQATPVDKHGANIQGTVNSIQASSAGDRVTFYLNGGLPVTGGSSRLSTFIASRGTAGWNSDGVLPLTDAGFSAGVLGWSDDLSTTAVEAPGPGDVGKAIYLRDSAAAFQLGAGDSTSHSSYLGESALAGFAADTSHLIFESKDDLLPGTVFTQSNLYELDHGTLTLAGRIPAGSATSCDDDAGPACVPAPEGSFAGPYDFYQSILTRGGALESYYTQNTISRDGSRVFFTATGSAQLYMREDAARTTQISASQRAVPDPNGHKPAAFMAATPDGSKVFFASCEKLTDDSTAVSFTTTNTCSLNSLKGAGEDLYSYDTSSGHLTDLTVDPNVGDPRGAEVQGVLGISEDGSYLYFAANGVLAPGASPGSCRIGGGESADTCNLYVSHNGTTDFIASLSGDDSDDWLPLHDPGGSTVPQRTSRVTPDGRTLLFRSRQSLTGYDNNSTSACNGNNQFPRPCPEFFRYSAPDKALSCVSCNPTRVPPSGETVLGSERTFLHNFPKAPFLTRNLSADGNRVFFDSPDALLPTDINGVTDAYEWEAEGSGTCHTSGGCIYLISSGTSPDPSYFGDASANGDDAFFFTSQQLVPSDRDQLVDVYDAGVGGGLPSQHPLSPPTCTSTACQANPAPPPEQTPASAAFSGPGNAHQGPAARRCPKGKRKVRRAGKVRCEIARKQHKRHTNRGGSK